MSNDLFSSAARVRAAGSFASRASTWRAAAGSSSPSRYATNSVSNGSGTGPSSGAVFSLAMCSVPDQPGVGPGGSASDHSPPLSPPPAPFSSPSGGGGSPSM